MDVRNSVIISSRLICLLCLLYFGVNVNVGSAIALAALIASFTFLRVQNKWSVVEENLENPYKGKPKIASVEAIPPDLIEKVNKEVAEFVSYDAEHTNSLHSFEKIQQNTACIFAKKSKLWGSSDYDASKDIEYNINKSLPTFLKFTMLCEPLGLDGFAVELPAKYGVDVETFGQTVLEVMTCISQNDPSGRDCMKSILHRRGWVFEFNRITFFITTFAPCYPSSHPRYAYESDACYILFQPEISFARHDLPSDTIHTNWINPKTVRDQIRVAFKEKGQEYRIRNTLSFPMVWDIVRPLDKLEDFFEWWTQGKNV